MATLTIADLDNGKRDLETVDAVANSPVDTTTTRYGDNVLTLAGALRRLGYSAPIPYAPGIAIDSPLTTVEFGTPAVIYRPDPALVPFTTGAWDASQWRVVQNTDDSNQIYGFDSRPEAESAATTLPEGATVFIWSDITHSNRVTRNAVSSSTLVYVGLGAEAESTRFHQSGSGAVDTTVQDELSGFLRLAQFGAVGDGVTDDTAPVAAAMVVSATSGRSILVEGYHLINGDIPVPAAGVNFIGRDRNLDGFILNPQPSSVTGGTHAYFLADSGTNTRNVSFRSIGFKSTYNSSTWTGSMVFPVYQSAPNSGITHSDISFVDCLFFDLSFNGVYIAPHVGGTVRNVTVKGCKGDVTSLEFSSRFSNLYQGIIEFIGYPGHGSTYGLKQIINARVEGCTARGMRTLADMKRGHHKFLVADCLTEDMSDCHHSVDGSSVGILSNLIGGQTSNLIPNRNFIEIQGEDVQVVNYEYDGTLGLGSVAGVLVTPYAYPSEGAAAYHQSRRVVIKNGIVKGINQNAVRLQDTIDCSVEGLHVERITQSAVSIEHPAVAPNGGSNAAFPIKNKVSGIRAGVGAGVFGLNLSSAAVGTRVGDIEGFLGKVTGSYNYTPLYPSNLNPNPQMLVTGTTLTGFSLSNGVSVANSATKPIDAAQSVLITATSPSTVATAALNNFVKVNPTRTLPDGTVNIGDVVSVRCSVQLGTAAVAGVLFQEFDASGVFISNDFQGLPGLSTSSFRENILYHAAAASNCAYVRVVLLPTSDSSGNPSGSSYWANVDVTTLVA